MDRVSGLASFFENDTDFQGLDCARSKLAVPWCMQLIRTVRHVLSAAYSVVLQEGRRWWNWVVRFERRAGPKMRFWSNSVELKLERQNVFKPLFHFLLCVKCCRHSKYEFWYLGEIIEAWSNEGVKRPFKYEAWISEICVGTTEDIWCYLAGATGRLAWRYLD